MYIQTHLETAVVDSLYCASMCLYPYTWHFIYVTVCHLNAALTTHGGLKHYIAILKTTHLGKWWQLPLLPASYVS